MTNISLTELEIGKIALIVAGKMCATVLFDDYELEKKELFQDDFHYLLTLKRDGKVVANFSLKRDDSIVKIDMPGMPLKNLL